MEDYPNLFYFLFENFNVVPHKFYGMVCNNLDFYNYNFHIGFFIIKNLR